MTQCNAKLPETFTRLGFLPTAFASIIARPFYLAWIENDFQIDIWWHNHQWYAEVWVDGVKKGSYMDTNTTSLTNALWKKFAPKYSVSSVIGEEEREREKGIDFG